MNRTDSKQIKRRAIEVNFITPQSLQNVCLGVFCIFAEYLILQDGMWGTSWYRYCSLHICRLVNYIRKLHELVIGN